MNPMVGQTLGKRLVETLDLPKGLVWLELRVALNEAVSVTCEHYVDRGKSDGIVTVLRDYELRERRPVAVDSEDGETIMISRAFLVDTVMALRHTAHLEQILERARTRNSRHDVGHELVLPERARSDHR